MNRKRGFWLGLWVVLVVVTGVLAFGSGDGNRGYGPWGGWGHMGGWGDGYQSQSEPGWFGMGPGMMGDAESGYGWGRGRFHSGKGYAMPDGSYGSMPWLPGFIGSAPSSISFCMETCCPCFAAICQGFDLLLPFFQVRR